MNTTRLLIGFTGLLLVGALLSCEDHRSQVVTPGANRLRVKRIEQGSQPGAARFVFTVTDFAYDAQNRLSSTTTYRPDSVAFPFERTLYQYDTQNRLTRVEHSEIRGGSRTETYFLTYNPAGQLAQVANLPSGISVAFQYNAANQLTGYTKALNVPGFRSTGGAGTLTFTGSNLTTELADFSVFREGGSPSAPPVYSWGGKMTYTYDVTGINPFYGVFVIPEPGQFFSPPGTSNFGPVGTLYGGIDNLFNVSPRNVATAFVSTGFGPPYREIYYNHTYNAVGLPTHRGIATFPFKIAQFVDYEYESY